MGLPDNFRAAGKARRPCAARDARRRRPESRSFSPAPARRRRASRSASRSRRARRRCNSIRWRSRRGDGRAARSPPGCGKTPSERPALVYSSADPAEVRAAQGKLGAERAGRAGRRPARRRRRDAARRRLHPLPGRGRRDLGRGGRRARRHGARDRAGDRSRRALDAQPRRAGRRAGVEVGQLRRAGFLPEGVDAAEVERAVALDRDAHHERRSQIPRGNLRRRALDLPARPDLRLDRQHQRAAAATAAG